MIDYALELKNEEFLQEFSGSRLWSLVDDLAKWSYPSISQTKIKNIFNAKSNEDKILTLKIRNELNHYIDKWAKEIPKNQNGSSSVFSDAKAKYTKLMAKNITGSQLSNPLEVKKIVFDPIMMTFDQSLDAGTYFSLVMSVRFKLTQFTDRVTMRS